MSEIQDRVVAKPRTETGKGAARKLRADGFAPAVMYGPGMEPQHLSVESEELVRVRRQFGRTHVYDVAVEGGETFKAMIREIQVEPVHRTVQHVDFWAVDLEKPIEMNVRIECTGKPVGVVAGGIFQQIHRQIRLSGLPEALPDSITVDVSGMEPGDTYRLNDLSFPEGCTPGVNEENFGVFAVSTLKE